MMRSPFVLTLLASAILLSGCSSSAVPEVGLTQPASQYDDRMLDSFGGQRSSEQQMLYVRKVKNLEHDLDRLEEKKNALESSAELSQLEAGAGKLQASDSEAVRMTDFASATQDSQVRIAKGAAEHAVKQSAIENDRDKQLMEAELEANRRLSELDQKFTGSIQSAQTETERARLKSELDVEKAKAEAQHKKALIEADTARDLSRLDQSYQSRITDAKSSASVVNQAASQESQKQRIKVVLANAESQRRVKEDVSASQATVTNLKAEKQSATQLVRDEISKLNEQIIALQGRATSIEVGYDSKIAIEQSRLNTLLGQSQQLADVEQSLINTPVSQAVQPYGDLGSRDVQRLEDEAQRARSDLLVQKANRIAEVEQQLSHDLDLLSARLASNLASAPTAGSVASAQIEKSASESTIKSDLAAKRTQITNDARSQLAELVVKTEIDKAGVVAPVLTNRAVYSGSYGEKPQAFAARESNAARELVAKAKVEIKPIAVAKRVPAQEPIQPGSNDSGIAPLVVASTFEPRPIRPARTQVDDVVIATGVMAGGDLKPLIVAPAATKYTVVYRYTEKGSADKFMAYLRAYGVNDFTYRYSEKLGQHILLMGSFTSKDQAAGRVAFLNKTTATTNAQIVEADL